MVAVGGDGTLNTVAQAAHADRHLADGEALVLAAGRRYWGIGDEEEASSLVAAAPQAA